jgi:SAM-dependent methyltransferase
MRARIIGKIAQKASGAVHFLRNNLEKVKLQRDIRLFGDFKDNPGLSEFHKSLKESFQKYSKEFGRGAFYQSLKSIHAIGQRPTEKRFEIYGLGKFLKKNFRVLDIGSNCGFFSLYVSQFVHSVDGIEKDPYMVEVAAKTQKFLKIRNCSFHRSIFEDFKPNKKYDCILSFAVHRRVRYPLEVYLGELDKILNKSGFLVLESHNAKKEDINFIRDAKAILGKRYSAVREGKIKDDSIIDRNFIILKKK